MPRFLRSKMIVTSPITTNHHQSPTNHFEYMWPITFQSPQRFTAGIIPAGIIPARIIIHIRVLPAPDKAHIGIEFHCMALRGRAALETAPKKHVLPKIHGRSLQRWCHAKNPESLWKEIKFAPLYSHFDFPNPPPHPRP